MTGNHATPASFTPLQAQQTPVKRVTRKRQKKKAKERKRKKKKEKERRQTIPCITKLFHVY